MKVSITTLGCKQNKYESDCVANILIKYGYEVTEKLCKADIYILNTCAVTNESEKKSRQYLSKFKRFNSNGKIIIMGCASQNNMEQFDGDNIFSIIGTERKQDIISLIKEKIKFIAPIPTKYSSIENPLKLSTREHLKIQDGCDKFCSYCLIPYLRGRSRSRSIEEIVDEAGRIASRSHEIVLTGIDISDYKVDGKLALPKLIRALKDVNAIIRLGSLEVNVITDELLRVLSKMKNFAPHFHLSLQSGDNNVLKSMNRHYTTELFEEKVKLIRRYFKSPTITTDVIVGYCTEGEEEFKNTCNFLKKIRFTDVHIFPYSQRDGTASSKLNDINQAVKKERVDILEKINQDIRRQILEFMIGDNKKIIIEEFKDGYFTGFSPDYIKVYLDNKNCVNGQIVKVKIKELYLDGVKGVKVR